MTSPKPKDRKVAWVVLGVVVLGVILSLPRSRDFWMWVTLRPWSDGYRTRLYNYRATKALQLRHSIVNGPVFERWDHPGGVMAIRGAYEKREPVGVWTYWDESGRILFQEKHPCWRFDGGKSLEVALRLEPPWWEGAKDQ